MALRIVIDALLVIGAFFALAGTLGVLKMPDTFCRMQASTCITTLGMLGVAICMQSSSWGTPRPR